MTEHLTALLSLAWLVWIALVAVGLILERRSPTATLAWLLALLFMPYFGFLVYLLLGPRRLYRRRRRYGRARNRLIQSTHHLRPGSTPSGFPAADLEPQLARLLEQLGQGAPSPAAAATLLETGDTCFQALETALAAAQHHIHLEYYLWQPDRVGSRLRDRLVEKARAGVAVRLLLDPIGSDRITRRFLQPLRDAGGMTAWFNPLRLRRLRPNPINFRTHRKIVVCDGRMGFIGGINISEAHSASCRNAEAWRDTHLRIEGEPVHRLQFIFLEDWYFATDHAPFQPEFFPYFPPHAAGPWMQIIESGPDNHRQAIAHSFFAAITGAQRRVLLSTPYFVPNEALNTALISAALRGVEVRLLTPKRSDSGWVTAAARSYYEELVNAGVLIYEYGPPMLHTKLLVIDERIAAIGSANFDPRSLTLNFEAMAILYDVGLAVQLAHSFAADLQHAQRYRKPGRRALFGQRLAEATARLLSPLL